MTYPYHMMKKSKPIKQENKNMSNVQTIEKFSTDNFSTHDPWPQIPTQFEIQAQMVDDSRTILIKLPTPLIGYKLSVGGEAHKRYLHLEGGPGGFLVGKGVDIDGKGLGARLQLDASIFGIPFLPSGWSKWATRRFGSRLPIGTLIDFLSPTYVTKSDRDPATVVNKPTSMVVNTIKIEDEMKFFKKNIGEINAAVRKNGMKLFIKDDGLLGAKMEF